MCIIYKTRDAEGQRYATRRHGDPVLEPANKIMTTPGRFVQRCVVRIAAAYIIIIFFVFSVGCVCVCLCNLLYGYYRHHRHCRLQQNHLTCIHIIYTYSNLYKIIIGIQYTTFQVFILLLQLCVAVCACKHALANINNSFFYR